MPLRFSARVRRIIRSPPSSSTRPRPIQRPTQSQPTRLPDIRHCVHRSEHRAKCDTGCGNQHMTGAIANAMNASMTIGSAYQA